MSCSARGRSRLAFDSVVLIFPCRKSSVARLARMSFSCAGVPPRRGPLVGVGISFAPFRSSVQCGGAASSGPAWRQPGLELLCLAVVVGVVVDVAERVHHVRRIEGRRAVLEAQAHAGELHLDLVDRLLTEIPYIQEVGLGAPDQLADAVDALALEAVVRPDGE